MAFGIKSIVISAALGIGLLTVGSTWISYSNQEKTLRVTFENEKRANQADYDNMWKTIAQKYEVKGDFESTYKTIVTQVAQGRSGGALFKSVQEVNPNIDLTLYKEVTATIEGKRDQFESHQKRLSDIKAEHDKVLTLFPGSLFVGGRPPLELKMVTSSRTDNAFETGQDDDVSLNKNKK